MDYGDAISASAGIITTAMASCLPPQYVLAHARRKAGLECLLAHLIHRIYPTYV